MGHKNWADKIGAATDLQDECVPGLPIIEIAGDRRVLIENHCGVIEYGKQRIVVQIKGNYISVTGENLELTKMTPQQLIISGSVHSVELIGR